jgi:cytochrome c-type biogenesis protein CcmH/NrfF
MRRTIRTAAAVTLIAALAVVPTTALATSRVNFYEVEAQFMCVTCNIPLQVAESPAADQEKAYLQSLIARGDSTAQIKAAMIAQFGAAVLALPPDRGFNVAVYIVPVAVLALALALVAVLVPRWRRQRRTAAPEAAAPTPAAQPSEAETARLNADLARFET